MKQKPKLLQSSMKSSKPVKSKKDVALKKAKATRRSKLGKGKIANKHSIKTEQASSENSAVDSSEKSTVGIQQLIEAAQVISTDGSKKGSVKAESKQTAIVAPSQKKMANKKHGIQHPNFDATLLNTLAEDLNEDGKKELHNICQEYDPSLLRSLFSRLAKLEQFRSKNEQTASSTNDTEDKTETSSAGSNSSADVRVKDTEISPFQYFDPSVMLNMMMQQMYFQQYMPFPSFNPAVNMGYPGFNNYSNFPSNMNMRSTPPANATNYQPTASSSSTISSKDNDNTNFGANDLIPDSSALKSSGKEPVTLQNVATESDNNTLTAENNLKNVNNRLSDSNFPNITTNENELHEKLDDSKTDSSNSESTTTLQDVDKSLTTNIASRSEEIAIRKEENAELAASLHSDDSNMSVEYSYQSNDDPKSKVTDEPKGGNPMTKFLPPSDGTTNSFLSFVNKINDSSKTLENVEADGTNIDPVSFKRKKDTDHQTTPHLIGASSGTELKKNPTPFRNSFLNFVEKFNAQCTENLYKQVPTDSVNSNSGPSSAEASQNHVEIGKIKKPQQKLDVVTISDDEVDVEGDGDCNGNSKEEAEVLEVRTYQNLTSVKRSSLEQKAKPNNHSLLAYAHSLPMKEKISLLQGMLRNQRKDTQEINASLKSLINTAAAKNSKRPSTQIPEAPAIKRQRTEIQSTNSAFTARRTSGTSSPSRNTVSGNSRALYLQDKDGDTILHIAIAKENIPVALDVIKKMQGFGLDIMNALGQTPLHLAFYVHQLDIIRCLLHHGANIEIVDGHGNSVLSICCEEDSPEMLDCLFEFRDNHLKYIDLARKRNNYGLGPLHIAMEKGNLEMIKRLVHYRVDIDLQEEKTGATALIMAMQKNDWNLAKYFIKQGADVNIPTYSGYYPLNFAIQAVNKELVELLLSRNAEIGCRNVEFEDDSEVMKEIRKIVDKEMRRRRRKKTLECSKGDSPKR